MKIYNTDFNIGKLMNNIGENVYSRVFGVTDYESFIRFLKLKMAD